MLPPPSPARHAHQIHTCRDCVSQDAIPHPTRHWTTVYADMLWHRRHAERIAQLWFQRVKEATPNKKLNLIYLANGTTPPYLLDIIL